MANVIQSAISSIRRKADEMLNDNQGWFRGGQFTPVQQLKENFTKAPTMSIGIAQVPNVFNPQVRQINSNFLNKAGSTLQNQFNIQKRDFNEYFINPLKEHPVLGPATTNIEKGVSALGRTAQGYGEYFKTLKLPQEQRQQQLKQLESKYTYGNAFKETKDVTKGVLTAYGLASPQTAVKSMLGGGLINTAIQGVQNVANKIPVTTGMGESFLTGAGTGLAYSGTNRLTNGLVQYFSNSIPLLNSLTEQSIQKGAPVATDTLKMGIKKFFSTAGKNILKAAVIETAVETPIWGTLNQKEQETLLQSFQREAVENLAMNVGMAGVNTLTDSKALFPIIKKSINDVIQNKIYSPEGIALQSGKINFGADVGNVKPSQPIKTGGVGGVDLNSQIKQLEEDLIDLQQRKKLFSREDALGIDNAKNYDFLIEDTTKKLNQLKAQSQPIKTGGVGDLTWAKGTRAAGIQNAGIKNYNQATKALEKAGELPTVIKTDKTTKDFIKNYYETKKIPVVGDIFENAKGEKVEITKIGDNSVDYFLKGKKKGISGTVYLENPISQPIKTGELTPEQTLKNNTLSDARVTKVGDKYKIVYRDVGNGKTGVINEYSLDTFDEAFKKAEIHNKHLVQLHETMERMSQPGYNNRTGKVEPIKTGEVQDFELPQGTMGFAGPVKSVIPESKGIIGSESIGTQSRNLTPQGDISVPKVQTELPVPNKSLQSQDIIALPEGQKQQIIVRNKAQLKKVLAENPNANVRIELKPEKGKITTYGSIPDRADVQATLPNRLNSFIDDVLGYSTQAPKGGKKQASLWTRTLRKGQTAITTKVEEALGSENPYIRNGATFLQNFFRGLGMSPERAKASMELRGEMSVANDRAYNVMDELYKSLGNNKKSLERINAVLDPEISKNKVSFDDLSKSEKQAYGLIREGLDLVHDTSYANGHISPELYVKNKGKYTPRLYEVTELPPEVNKFVTQGKKLNNDLYKQRKDVDAWKQDNSLNDPVYALGKRLSQVETNSAIKKYTDFLASNKRFVSDVERPGFVKLSDSPVYGALSGKYVLNSAAEDLKGFFFSNQAMQNLYDVFRAYDRMPIRQLQKKLLTVFNPTTNVGNIVSDQVFGWVTGVDPFTLNKNLLDLKSNPKQFKQLSDYLMSKGVTGTDITRTDFVNKLGSIDELAKGTKASKFKLATDKVQQFYGGTDDAYKVSAFKSLLDKGFTLEEATRKVADGFQNYANVGKYYDLAAKTPIIGKPFIKFQGDLMRIIKNGAVNNPLGLISFLGTLKGVSYLSSKLSGETDEDRKTRETRFAAPVIPGLNIPLTWQTPIGEINVARYISPFYANNETTNIASNMLPFVPNIQKNKDFASNVAMNVNDPLLSPIVQLGVNRDFRGKPISDPDENKYQPSTLTPSEKLKNQALWTGRAYLPPPVNSAIDVGQVAATGKNMYGTPQTMTQSIARLGGVKISDMGAEEVQAIREKDAEYDQKGNEYIQKQIQSVKKQQLTGKISQETANNRIANLESQKKTVNTSLIKGSGDGFSYIDDNGSMQTINLKKYDDIKNLPSDNKYNSAIKESKQYSEAAKILDNTDLTTEQQQTALNRLGINKTEADYYRVANDNTNLKTMFVLDKVQNKSHDEVLQSLIEQRKQVNGQMVASNAVLDNLVDEGIITKAEATQLKKYKYENGKLTPMKISSGKTSGKKIKVTLRKVGKIKFKKAKVRKLKTKKFAQIKLPKYQGLKVKKFT